MEHRELLRELLKSYDSFYLYDQAAIVRSAGQLKEDFPGVEFLYSIKCNPHPPVVKSVFDQGFGADAASLGEVELAAAQGLEAGRIYYSAPGKSRADIAAALGRCVLIADSLGEVERIQAAAQKAGVTARIGVRIHPDYTFGGGAGGPSKFGMDEDQALAAVPYWKSLSNVEVVGLHVHLQSQELRCGVLEEYYKALFAMADRFRGAMGRELEFLNLGSGIGIQYSPEDIPLDTRKLGAALQKQMEDFHTASPGTRVIIEVGRYAVGKSGVYVTGVMDKKVSHGVTYVVLANTLNGFLRPSLARLVMGYAAGDRPVGSEPLFTAPDAFQFLPLAQEEGEEETVTLVGNLCTAADVVAKDISLPRLEVGDGVVITNAGSYAAVLSPMQFSSQTPPAQLFLTEEGAVLAE